MARPRKGIDMETVKRMYLDENLSTYQIAEYFGVSYNTINRRLREEGVPLKRWLVPGGRYTDNKAG